VLVVRLGVALRGLNQFLRTPQAVRESEKEANVDDEKYCARRFLHTGECADRSGHGDRGDQRALPRRGPDAEAVAAPRKPLALSHG